MTLFADHEFEYAEGRKREMWTHVVERDWVCWFQNAKETEEYTESSFGLTRKKDTEFVLKPDRTDNEGASASLALFHWYK